MADGTLTSPSRAIVFQWGASTVVRNKVWDNRIADAQYWESQQSTIVGLANHISQGYPWMPCLLDDGATRKNSASANLAYCLGVDIDNSRTERIEDPTQATGYRKEVSYEPHLTLEEAKEHPFIQSHAALLIESPSSTPDWPKFRLVFLLAQPIQGNANITKAYQYLKTIVPGFDPQCINSDRFFYGAEGVTPVLLRDNVTLPIDFFTKAMAWSKSEERKAKDRERKAKERIERLRANGDMAESDEDLARLMAPFFPKREPGSGNYGECFMIVSALVHKFGRETALSILEGSQLSIRVKESSGAYWDIHKKVESAAKDNGRSYNFGSLVHWANQQPGFKWPKKKSSKAEVVVGSSSKPSSNKMGQDSTSIEVDPGQSGWEPIVLKDKSIWGRLKNGPFAEIANFGLEIESFIQEPGNAPNRIQVRVIPQKGEPYSCVITAKERKRVESVKEALLRKNPDLSFRPNSDQLESIFVQLREKFLTNPTYKKVAPRLGRQEDGQWLMPHGYRPLGLPCDWIPDQDGPLPSPSDLRFPKQTQGALAGYLSLLSTHASETYLNNQLLALGATVAGLHYRSIIQHFEMMPVVNFYGPPGVGKSRLLAPCSALVGTRLYRYATEAAISNALDQIESIPLFLDDPDKGGNQRVKLDFTKPFMASALHQDTATALTPWRMARRNILLTSNQKVIGNDGAVQARTISVECNPIDKPIVDEGIRRQLMAQADGLASSFEEVLSIPLNLDNISELVDALSEYRITLDDRTIKGLAVYTYFAQEIAQRFLAKETNFLSYVFSHLIPLQVEEQHELSVEAQLVEALKDALSQDRIGPWNITLHRTKGVPYIAIRRKILDELSVPWDWAILRQYIRPTMDRLGFDIAKGAKVRFFRSRDLWRKKWNDPDCGIPQTDLETQSRGWLIDPSNLPETFIHLSSILHSEE